MIRLREISVQLNIRECFFSNTNQTNQSESCKCVALALSRVIYWIISISAAASGNACKSV